MPANDIGHEYDEITWSPREMSNLKHFKESVVSYSMHSPFVKQILSNWVTPDRIIPEDWKRLMSVVLEAGQ